jgi:hypothetical protein
MHRMIDEGYFRPTGETHTNEKGREVPFYELAFDVVALRPWLADASGAETAPQKPGSGAEKQASRVQRGCTPHKETTGDYEQTDVCSVRARGPDRFEEFWTALPQAMREISSKPKTRALIAEKVLAAAHGWDRLVAAARAYEASPVTRRQDFLPKAVTWLGEERFLEFLPGATPAATDVAAPSARRAPFSDPAIRAAFVSAKGEDWTASWLDGGAMSAAGEIAAAGPTAADHIRRDAWALLKRLNLTLSALVPQDA